MADLQRPDADDLPHRDWRCADCGASNSMFDADCQYCDGSDPDRCTDPAGHQFECTGTAYGGDDESYHGEGRCYCIHCGADGDA